jgi:hypothetical protein
VAAFHIDNDVPVAVAHELLARGHSAFTARDLGLMSAPDPVHVQHAARNNRINEATMTTANDLDPVTAEVYDFLRRQPGEAFAMETLAGQLGYAADEIKPSLAHLVGTGVVEERGDGRESAYIVSTAAPEL